MLLIEQIRPGQVRREHPDLRQRHRRRRARDRAPGYLPGKCRSATSSADRLRRFFTKTDDHNYQVNKRLRDTVVFAPQNLIGDAPFSKLDLISCRNLLIYLEPEVQKKVDLACSTSR